MAAEPELTLGADRRRIATRIAAIISEVDPELNDIAADLTRLYRANIPVYDRVDADSIERNTHRVLRMVVRQMRGDAETAGFQELATLARAWAEQQIPLDLVAHSVQLGARRIFELIRQRATAQAVPAADIDQMQDLTWEWATASATAVHLVLQERAVTVATRRADFLRRLLDGDIPPAVVAAEARGHGLDPGHRYHVACAEWQETARASELLATLRIQGSTTELPVLDTVIDDHLVALLPRTPTEFAHAAPVAIGPAAPPADAPHSYRHARRILNIANRFHRNGLIDETTLGPLPLLDCAADTAGALDAKHLAPLRKLGPTGAEIATTVGTFLDCDRRIDDTATRLFVHRNTVRNRLLRFADITGLDLDKTDDLIVAWWLLKR